MRLQVFLSISGIASRRNAASIITSGKVSVNGIKIFEPSFKVDPEKDKVFLYDERIAPREKVYVVLNKPKGVTTTKKDVFAEKTVIDLLPRALKHLNPVGRLDKDTTGLLLLTNDGDLINRLTHPKFNIEKTYLVALNRRLSANDKIQVENGISLDGRMTARCNIVLKRGNDLEITMHEGRKRQIKRMFALKGYSVVNLKRLKEGMLSLGRLVEGEWRFLNKEEVRLLISNCSN